MTELWFYLLLMLIVILISSELFTNAIEHFGERLNISSGVTGSIFAAIATALPETSIPIIAVFAGSSNAHLNQEIGVGAILGAPLMLATLSTFLMAVSVFGKRSFSGKVKPEKTGFVRDLNFFLVAFFLAICAMYIPEKQIFFRTSVSFILVVIYVLYLILTIKASKQLVNNGHGIETDEPLLMTKIGFPDNSFTLFLQLIGALVLLIIGAKGFITNIEKISQALNVSALLLSLLIVPIATELPEKVNSIFWIRKGKDTLAFGNITGAMVFQGTLLPAIGILLTSWFPTREAIFGMIITLLAALWLRFNASSKGIWLRSLIVNGILYFLYLFITLV